MKNAWKQPGFPLLFIALTISMFGDSIMLLVFSIWVKDLTGSNSLAGLTFLFVLLPSLLAIFLGVYVDRLPRQAILKWSHLAMGAAMLPLLLVRDSSDLWIIWTVAVAYGFSMTLMPAALNGILKEMVPDDLLAEANGAIQSVREGLRLFGPLIGAGLYGTIGASAVAIVDSASFVVAGILITFLAVGKTAPTRASAPNFKREIGEGVKHLATEPILRHVLVGFVMMLLVVGFFESLIFAILDAFNKPAAFASVVVTCQGVGAAIGAVTGGRLTKRFGEVTVMVISLGALSISVACIAASTTLMAMLLSTGVCGLTIPPLFIAFNTLIQRRTPDELIGRVSTTVESLLGGPQALSIATGAMLVSVVPYVYALIAIAAVIAISAAYVGIRLRHRFGQIPSIAEATT